MKKRYLGMNNFLKLLIKNSIFQYIELTVL